MVPRDLLITCHGYLFYSLLTLLLSAEEENEEVAHEGESKSAEALEADKDDSRQHLNVVFIGHVGKRLQCYI
jgi:ACT domain-containing protein